MAVVIPLASVHSGEDKSEVLRGLHPFEAVKKVPYLIPCTVAEFLQERFPLVFNRFLWFVFWDEFREGFHLSWVYRASSLGAE